MNQKQLPMWATPPSDLVLAEDEVHIWRANLALPDEEIEQLSQILSEDELSRAAKFHFPVHKQRYIAARGILRTLLSIYLQYPGDRLMFEYSDRGKPKLAQALNQKDLQFNLSHSQDLAVYGFTLERRIGIDLEYLRSATDVEAIAARFFAARESQLICSLTGVEQQRAFFQIWTAKEAYLKATGEGLTGSLAQVEVGLNDSLVNLHAIDGNFEAAKAWFLFDFVPATEYVATIAVEGLTNPKNMQFWHWALLNV